MKTTELGESAINKLKPYELSKTSVKSSKVASSHLIWCIRCCSLLSKVLDVCVSVGCERYCRREHVFVFKV